MADSRNVENVKLLYLRKHFSYRNEILYSVVYGVTLQHINS